MHLIHCYKIVFGAVDLNFSDFFEFSSVTATGAMRTNCTNQVVLTVLEVGILQRTVNVWNFLPSSVNFCTLSAFKRSIVCTYRLFFNFEVCYGL